MPDAMIREETPLRAVNWINMSSLNSQLFDIYKAYPTLTDIPKEYQDEQGNTLSNDERIKLPKMLLNAIEEGLLGIVVITDYLAPTLMYEGGNDSGYMMGYIIYTDWENENLVVSLRS